MPFFMTNEDSTKRLEETRLSRDRQRSTKVLQGLVDFVVAAREVHKAEASHWRSWDKDHDNNRKYHEYETKLEVYDLVYRKILDEPGISQDDRDGIRRFINDGRIS